MKLDSFKKKLNNLEYSYERSKNKLFITDGRNVETNGFKVARVILDEEYGVYFDYCTPFTKELYDLVYEFIKTPLSER